MSRSVKSAHFSGVLLLRQEYLTVAALSDLGQDLEVGMPESHSSFTQIGPFPSSILVPHMFIGFLVGLRRGGIFGLESIESILPISDISEEIEVVVQEV
jgi:hypothetical protein